MSHSEPSNSIDGAPAVDFMALLGRCLGNFKIVERVLATFRETGWTDLCQLQDAFERCDFAAVVEISHRFKGAASNVSAAELTKLLVMSEQYGHEQDRVRLAQTLSGLRTEWEVFKRFAQAFAPVDNAYANSAQSPTPEPSETPHACAGC